MHADHRARLLVLRAILAAGILSTAVHYTHNFVEVDHYPGPRGLDTITRVAIVVAWPLLTAIGLMGYRRYAERRLRVAHASLAVYSLLGLATLGHFAYGKPGIPAVFYASIFTDAITAIAVLSFVAWSMASSRDPSAAPRTG